MTYAKQTWPPRPAVRALPPAPRRDVRALVAHHAPAIAKWTPAQRWELHQIAVNSLLEIMRDCDDPKVRADAFAVLVKMGVAQPC